MPQAVKISTNVISGSINKNGVSFNIEGAGRNFGSLDGGNWYSNVLPDDGRWVIISESKGSGKPAFWLTAGSADSDLLTTVNGLPSRYNLSDFTATGSALDYLVQNDYMVLRAVPDQSDADSVVLDVDASNLSSYPRTGTTWYDLSGYDDNGALQNGVSFNYDKFTLDNVDDRIYIPGPDYNALASSGDFTIIITGKKTAYGTGGNNVGNSTLFQGAGSGYTEGWRITENNTGTPGTAFTSPHSITIALPQTVSTRAVSDTIYRPFFYAFSFTGGNTGLAFLNENISQGSNSYGTGGGSLGYISYTSYGVGNWAGDIQSVKVYDKGLSLSEIRQNYYGGPIVTDGLVFAVDAGNLVSYESGSTTSYSLTGSDPGTLLNGTEFVVGNGGVFRFDGVNDYILQDTNNTNCNPGLTNDITIECWSNPTFPTSSALYGVVGKMGTPIYSVRNGWMVGWNNGKAYATFRNEDLNYGIATIDLGTNITADNQWHHIIATLNRDVGAKIYVDGELKTSVLSTKTQGYDLNSANPLVIGRFSQYGAYQMDGDIGDVRVYNRELTADEVAQNYNAQKQKFQK